MMTNLNQGLNYVEYLSPNFNGSCEVIAICPHFFRRWVQHNDNMHDNIFTLGNYCQNLPSTKFSAINFNICPQSSVYNKIVFEMSDILMKLSCFCLFVLQINNPVFLAKQLRKCPILSHHSSTIVKHGARLAGSSYLCIFTNTIVTLLTTTVFSCDLGYKL